MKRLATGGGQTAEHVLGTTEGRLEVDMPVSLPGLREQKIERGRVGGDGRRQNQMAAWLEKQCAGGRV